MIVYFANREMDIVGQASTELPKGLLIEDDKKTEDIESGTKSFECTFTYNDFNAASTMTEAGNYILRNADGETEFYTIIDTEINTETHTINVYAEDAGLDLLNEVVGAYTASSAMSIAAYTSIFAADSGFEIRVNEVSDMARTLSWDGEATVTERLMSLAAQFDAEISFTFEIYGLGITHKYINYWKKRGKNAGMTLRVGTHIPGLLIKKTVADLATGLYVTGDDITLSGYSYDDGDIYVSGANLLSRTALAKWSRFLSPTEPGTGSGHIIKAWNYSTSSQAELCTRAVNHLKQIYDVSVSYEADVVDAPDGLQVGDVVRVVDSESKIYLTARLQKMETSSSKGERKITLVIN